MSMTKEGIKHNSMFSAFYADDGIDLKKIVELLYRHIWVIAGTGLCTFFIAFLYTFTIKPQFISSTLIQISSQSNNSMMFNPLLKNNQSTSQTQLALLKTRYILEPLVVQNGLNVVVAPRYFPVFGAWKANHYSGAQPAPAFLGLKSYAWGGEQVVVKRLAVPSTLVDQGFKLIAGSNQTYKLYSADGSRLILNGKVNVPYTTSEGIMLELSTLHARPGTEFNLSYQSPISVADSLGRSIRINPVVGTDPTVSTGISEIQFVNGNPALAANILRDIVNFAAQKNAHQKAAETQKTLAFLNKKLPEVTDSIKNSEDIITDYHSNKGVFSATIAAQTLTQRWLSLSQTAELLRTQREELLQIYTPRHPLVISLEFKIKQIEKSLAVIGTQIRKLPTAKLEEMRLDRELKIKNVLFNTLYNQKQQLELVKAGLVSDIRVLTDVSPASQLPTHKSLIMLFGLLAGMFAASLVILVRNMFVKTIENADQLESEIRLPVQTILPFSRKQKHLEKSHAKSSSLVPLILAKQDPDDITIEGLRSLQVNMHIANTSSNQVIALMGSMNNIGKSFVSLNLAQVIAESGKKTLLIDADVRRGRLHNALLQSKANGLSEHLEGTIGYQNLVRPIHENLFFIPCGSYNNQPIELFRSTRFKELIEQVRKDFDQIIIDTPPILPVTDSILIAQHCDTKLFVVSAGKDTMKDVKQAIKKVASNRIELNGIVLNHRRPLTPYGSRHHYRYSYTAIA